MVPLHWGQLSGSILRALNPVLRGREILPMAEHITQNAPPGENPRQWRY